MSVLIDQPISAPTRQTLPHSSYRPLRFFLEGSSVADNLVDQLRAEFLKWRNPPKADAPQFAAKCIATLRLMVLNLAAVAMSNRHQWLQTLANRTWYSQNAFWMEEEVSQASVKVCRKFLVEAGYVTYSPGERSSSRRYRRPAAIQVTGAFVVLVKAFGITTKDIWRSPDRDLIQLKGRKRPDGTKPRIPFAWDDDLSLKARNLSHINRLLNEARLGINVTPEEWGQILDHIARKQDLEFDGDDTTDATLDLSQKTLYRVFNNGSFEEGGRFYGAWWQALPKRWRSYVTIGGRKIVEVDYAAMHPTALSHQLGIPAEPHFYEIGIGTKPIVKATFNALINARGVSIKPVKGFDEAEVGMPWTVFLKKLKAHYSAYSSYFGSGYGLKLQKLDSDVAEAVMLHFAAQGKVVLPVHDSFICDERLERELVRVMEYEFNKCTGGSINLRKKRLSPRQRNEIRSRQA